MINLLNRLCHLPGVSGDEGRVQKFIFEEIKDFADVKIDPLGNIIAFKKGQQRSALNVMFCAHMDEVGFIITNITDEGCLKFAAVGGIDDRILPGLRVKISERQISGVIGVIPVHLLPKEQRDKPVKQEDLYIDIGAKDKAEAEKYINLGDTAVFDSDFVEFADGLIKCKAIDDRLGCALLINLVKSQLQYDMYFAFTVQEEVGLRGAATCAFNVKPDIAVVVEATTAADFSGIDEDKRVCRLGKGGVLTIMDNKTYYDKNLLNFARDIADKKNIKWQAKEYLAGANDAGAIGTSIDGVRVLALSAPCRYLHTPSCVINLNDVYEMEKLLKELCSVSGGEFNDR